MNIPLAKSRCRRPRRSSETVWSRSSLILAEIAPANDRARVTLQVVRELLDRVRGGRDVLQRLQRLIVYRRVRLDRRLHGAERQLRLLRRGVRGSRGLLQRLRQWRKLTVHRAESLLRAGQRAVELLARLLGIV